MVNNNKLSINQIGFLPKIGCEPNLLRILEEIKSNMKKPVRNKDDFSWTLFIDLKSAFDKVNHELMFERLKEIDIDIDLINTIKWLYR